MRNIIAALILSFGIVVGSPILAAAAPVRVEVPIHQTKIGTVIRYSIPIRIGNSVPVEAMLDTGSTGIRILPGAASPSDYSLTRRPYNNSWPGATDEWEGRIASATVSIGGIASNSPVPIQVVLRVVCDQGHPGCLASQQSIQQYRMIGAFQAMIGASMPTHRLRHPLVNPLISIADAWIVELPMPGSQIPGKLILNPNSGDKLSYTLFVGGLGPNVGGGRDNPLPGCLLRSEDGENYCGPVVFDTGMYEVTVITNKFNQTVTWRAGTTAVLGFKNRYGAELAADFTVLPTERETQVRLGRFPQIGQSPTRILAGIMPYLAFSVLYDYRNGKIGLKRRETAVELVSDTTRTAIPQHSGNATTKVYRGRNGTLTMKTQGANALSFSLSVGYLNSDGKCSEGEIKCETIDGAAHGGNGRYEFQDSIDPGSGFIITLSDNSLDISNVHGAMGTGTGNRDIIGKIAGTYTAATNATTSRAAVAPTEDSEQLRAACPVISRQYCPNQTGIGLRACIEENRDKYATLSSACTRLLGD